MVFSIHVFILLCFFAFCNQQHYHCRLSGYTHHGAAAKAVELHPSRQFLTARSWPGDLKQLPGKSVEIVYGLRRGSVRHRHVSPVPVGRNGKYRLRSGDAMPEPARAFGIAVRLDRIHRVAMPEKIAGITFSIPLFTILPAP